MSKLIFIITLAFCATLLPSAEPYVRAQVPWAVYVPLDASDKDGHTDPNKFLHGDDNKGWYTYLVFRRSDGALININSEFYDGAGNPVITQEDINNVNPATDPVYAFMKMILIQPCKTPSDGIASSDFIDEGANQFTLGHQANAVGYRTTEKLSEGLSIGADYWLAEKETNKNFWRCVNNETADELSISIKDYILSTRNTKSRLLDFGRKRWQEISEDSGTQHYGMHFDEFVVVDSEESTHSIKDTEPGGLPERKYIKHYHPVSTKNYVEIETFCNALTTKIGGKRARIPNELEWEYAARAGEESELPLSFIQSDNPLNFNVIDPVTEAELSITDVFKKTYEIPDVPIALVGDHRDFVRIGFNTDGSPKYSTTKEIVTLKFEADIRLQTKRPFQIVVNDSVNYDKRYPAKMRVLKSRNFFWDGNRFTPKKVITEPSRQVVKATALPLEYYPNEESLSRAVNGMWMGVQKDGSYAASILGGSYTYDPELVHHFVQITDENIWPPNHPTGGPMDKNNTILTYLHWFAFDGAGDYRGTFKGYAKDQGLIDDVKDKLASKVRSYPFTNALGGDDVFNAKGKKIFTIPLTSNVYTDFNKTVGDHHGCITINKTIPDAVNGNGSHPWYYVSGWNCQGAASNTGYPIDDFAALQTEPKIIAGANLWGFRDMLGNASEFVIPGNATSFTARWDGITDLKNYSDNGNFVVLRGGSFNSSINDIRFSSRKAVNAQAKSLEMGFRLLIEQ